MINENGINANKGYSTILIALIVISAVIPGLIGIYFGMNDENSYNNGQNQHYDENYDDGWNDGYDLGNDSAYDDGSQDGEYTGYNDGWANATNILNSKGNPIYPVIDGSIEYAWNLASTKWMPFTFGDLQYGGTGTNYYAVGYNETHILIAIDACTHTLNNLDSDWISIALANGTDFSENEFQSELGNSIYTYTYDMELGATNFLNKIAEIETWNSIINDSSSTFVDIINGTSITTNWDGRSLRNDNKYYKIMSNPVDSHNKTLMNISINMQSYLQNRFPSLQQSDIIAYLSQFNNYIVNFTLGINSTDGWLNNTDLDDAYINITDHGITDISYSGMHTYSIAVDKSSITNDGWLNISIGVSDDNVSPHEFSVIIDSIRFRADDPRYKYITLQQNLANVQIASGFQATNRSSTAHRTFEIAIPRSQLIGFNISSEIGFIIGMSNNHNDDETLLSFEKGYWLAPTTPYYWKYGNYLYYKLNATEAV